MPGFLDKVKQGAGKAKDLAAGAVLLAMVAAVSIGVVVFGPRLF